MAGSAIRHGRCPVRPTAPSKSSRLPQQITIHSLQPPSANKSDTSWPVIREWIPADDTDPLAVFPEDIVSTHWVPKEIRLDDERTLVLDPS
jgi:hypothetical protein